MAKDLQISQSFDAEPSRAILISAGNNIIAAHFHTAAVSYRRETICLALRGGPNQIKCLEHIIKGLMVRRNQRPQACKSGKGPMTGTGLDGSDTMDVNSLQTPLLYKAYILRECHLQFEELSWLHYEDYDWGTNSTSTDTDSFSKLHLRNASLEDVHSSSSLSYFLLDTGWDKTVSHTYSITATCNLFEKPLSWLVWISNAISGVYRDLQAFKIPSSLSRVQNHNSVCLGGQSCTVVALLKNPFREKEEPWRRATDEGSLSLGWTRVIDANYQYIYGHYN